MGGSGNLSQMLLPSVLGKTLNLGFQFPVYFSPSNCSKKEAMKNALRLLLPLFFLLSATAARATHIIGGEITYQCLGNQQYEITLVVYRDCYNGNPAAFFDDPASIGVFDKDWNLFSELQIPFDPVLNDTLDVVLSNPCLAAPPDVCVHTTTYKGVVFLPFQQGGYKLVYQRCCRNKLIQNIVNPLDVGASFITEITEAGLLSCNNSPTFTNWPPIAICVNEPIDFDHSAMDVDGDSIVYKLCWPQNGADPGTPMPQPPNPGTIFDVTWVPPYSLLNMLNNPPGKDSMKIDLHTGFITGVPNTIGNFVVAICIEEYRNGILLTRIQRDFQYNVADCGKAVAAFFAPEVLCDTKTIHFVNKSSAKSSKFVWYFDWPNLNGPTDTLKEPTYTFPDTGYYQIALLANPGAVCDDTAYQTIYVTNSHIKADFDFKVVDCFGPATIEVTDLTTDTVFAVATWDWTVSNGVISLDSKEKTPIFTVPSGTDFWTLTLVATSANGCMDTLVKNFQSPFPSITAVGGFYSTCKGQPVNINPTGNPAYNYEWSPPLYLDDPTADNPVCTPDTSITYLVKVTNGFCSDTATVIVSTHQPTAFFTAPDVVCDNLTVTFLNQSQSATKYKWYFQWPMINYTASTFNGTYTFPDTGSYTIALIADPTQPCRDTFFRTIHLTKSTLAADFSVETYGCQTDSIFVKATDLSTDPNFPVASWSWFLTDNQTIFLSSTQQNPLFGFPNKGATDFDLTLTVMSASGCSLTFTKSFNINIPDLTLINDVFSICAGQSVALNPNGNPAWTYQWSPATGLDNPNLANPTATPSGQTEYTVQVSNGTCTAKKLVKIFVTPGSSLTVTATPDTILIGESSQLFASSALGASNWSWVSDPSLSDDKIRNPLAMPTVTTTYFVSATGNNGCPATGSVIVVVRNPTCEEPFVFLPTAFSPNGDGANDSLVVYGQDVLELSLVIYDRWGEKVFEAKSIAEAWDGTFKGKKLPPDSYAYRLHVKCAGGRESIRQGNITLVR